jgi:hypothetical protein
MNRILNSRQTRALADSIPGASYKEIDSGHIAPSTAKSSKGKRRRCLLQKGLCVKCLDSRSGTYVERQHVSAASVYLSPMPGGLSMLEKLGVSWNSG